MKHNKLFSRLPACSQRAGAGRRQLLRLINLSLLGPSLIATGLSISVSHAQTSYPDRPIKLIVPFAAGGPTDMVGRLMAHGMEKELGQNIIVENKPGGGSNIGSELVARAKPDGYTLLLGTIANATNMSIYNNLNYSTERDLVAITQFMSSPSVLVVNPSIPVKNLDELIAYAKANPGKLSFASSGAGGSPHLAGEMLKLRANIDLLHVPYKGASPALNDVLGGNVSMGFMTAAGALPSINAGKLRAIAVAGAQRLPQLPDVPTMQEAGITDFEVSSWNGLFAPAGTPPAILQKLAEAALKVITQPEMQKTFESHASLGVGGTPEQFKQYVHAEIVKWEKVAKAASIKLN
jgi:tripartite-type tricarboxylate transporter receptor subunit TctC